MKLEGLYFCGMLLFIQWKVCKLKIEVTKIVHCTKIQQLKIPIKTFFNIVKIFWALFPNHSLNYFYLYIIKLLRIRKKFLILNKIVWFAMPSTDKVVFCWIELTSMDTLANFLTVYGLFAEFTDSTKIRLVFRHRSLFVADEVSIKGACIPSRATLHTQTISRECLYI